VRYKHQNKDQSQLSKLLITSLFRPELSTSEKPHRACMAQVATNY